LHWRSSLRPTWFFSARRVETDAQGRFHIEGLERGESFSLLSDTQRFGSGGEAARKQGVLSVSVSALRDFESPRFTTCRQGETQDLGDLIVHPSHAQNEVFHAYGVSSRQVVSAGVLETSNSEAIEEARAALSRYHQALRSGDVQALHRLTS